MVMKMGSESSHFLWRSCVFVYNTLKGNKYKNTKNENSRRSLHMLNKRVVAMSKRVITILNTFTVRAHTLAD